MPAQGRYLKPEFRTNTPVRDATIVEEWDVWDGPLYGICEINGGHFFFTEILEFRLLRQNSPLTWLEFFFQCRHGPACLWRILPQHRHVDYADLHLLRDGRQHH